MRALLVLFAALLLTAQSASYAPLYGTWNGEWKITQGTDDIAGKFRVSFAAGTPLPDGRFMNVELTRTHLDGRRNADKVKLDRREYRVDKLQVVSADPPRFRFFAAGQCWNADVKGEKMEGFFNAGACSSMGMGAGARAVEFTATRTPAP